MYLHEAVVCRSDHNNNYNDDDGADEHEHDDGATDNENYNDSHHQYHNCHFDTTGGVDRDRQFIAHHHHNINNRNVGNNNINEENNIGNTDYIATKPRLDHKCRSFFGCRVGSEQW